MRKSIKNGIVAAAVAASALGAGAGVVASAAAPASAATVAAVSVAAPHQVVGSWVQLQLKTSSNTYTGYWLYLHEAKSGLLTGWLFDPNLPAGSQYLAITGGASNGGEDLVFAVNYPAASGQQGTRAFVSSNGGASGVWTETGTEGLMGTFTA